MIAGDTATSGDTATTGAASATGASLGRAAPAALLLFLGVVAVQLVRTQAYLRYVKPGLGPWLMLTGAALALLGAAGLFAALQPQPSADGAAPAPRVGVLLLVPLGLLVLVGPPALGSYGLQGQATRVLAAQEPAGTLPPPRQGAVELTLREYAQRALFQAPTLTGARLRLLGFAVPATAAETDRHGPGFYLTRIALSCCAADGTAVRVFVRTTPGDSRPAADSWWTVEGAAPAAVPAPGDAGSGGQPDVVLAAARLTAVAAPSNPYTH